MLKTPGQYDSDLALVRAASHGDPQALADFLRRMRCIPLSLAGQNARLGRPLNDQDLEDVAQEVLVLIWNRLGTYAGLSTLETWVYRFSAFTLMNAIRRRRTRLRVGELDAEAADTGPADPRAQFLEYEHVHRALERLDPVDADVVRLKHFEELTFEEIGGRLGLPTNTAKTKYYRGLGRLHEALKPHSTAHR